MTLTSNEIKIFEDFRNNFKKGAVMQVQKVYHKYNPNERRLAICCSLTNRKVAMRLYYDWYAQVTA